MPPRPRRCLRRARPPGDAGFGAHRLNRRGADGSRAAYALTDDPDVPPTSGGDGAGRCSRSAWASACFAPGAAWAASGPVWHETVAAGSQTRAATVRIPRAGTFTFWYATTGQHGRCFALGLPTGGWAGGPGGENVGGSLPGCYPTPAQINADQVEHGGGPVYAITGFDANESDLTVDGAPWRIYYGVVDGRGAAARVVDTAAGRSAPVVDGHLFAIAVSGDPSGSEQFVAYARNGAVVADTRRPLH